MPCVEALYPDDFISITFPSSFGCVKEILGYTDCTHNESSTAYFEKEFRWSIDNKSWSAWLKLTNENLSIVKGENVYIEAKYIRKGAGLTESLVFESLDFEITECEKEKTTSIVDKIGCCNAESCEAESIKGNKKSSINYYNLGGLEQLHKDLSKTAFEILGQCVTYYRVKPDVSSKDVVLHEYSLYKNTVKKEINFILPDNEMPNNEPEYNPFGYQYIDMPTVFHVSKEEFECIFGDGEMPQRKDFFYFPLMNIYYRIEDSYLKKDFMGKGTYYIINAYKWEDDTSIEMEEEYREEIDENTTGIEKAFDEDVELEEKRVTNPEQLTTFTGSFDILREAFDSKLNIEQSDLYVDFTLFAKNYYDLTKVERSNIAVKYDKSVSLSKEKNYSFTCWLNKQNNLGTSDFNVSKISRVSPTDNRTKIEFYNNNSFDSKDIIEISDSRYYDGIYDVLESTSEYIVIDTSFVTEETFFEGECFGKKYITENIFNAYSRNDFKGLGVSYSDNGIYVLYNNQVNFFSFELDNQKWYGLVLNIENNYSNLSLYIYDIPEKLKVPTDATSKSMILRYNESKTIDPEDISHSDNYRLNGSSLWLTNIRLFNKIIEPEEQKIVLTKYLETNAQWGILIDNAKPQLNIPRLEEFKG